MLYVWFWQKCADTGIEHLSLVLHGPIQDCYWGEICLPSSSNPVLADTGMLLHNIDFLSTL